MARRTSLKVNIITALASGCLGAAAALLLVTCLTSPTRKGSAITKVHGTSENGEYNMDLGILSGCSNFLRASFGGERDMDCDKTYGNGYQTVLLLPVLESELSGGNITYNPDGDRGYPLTYNTPYTVVTYGMTRGMVMIPIATALAFLAMLIFIFGSYKMTAGADYATTGLSFIAAILAWASFGIAYQLTPRVRSMLQRYNTEGLGNGFILETTRGNATWFLLVGAILSTLAVPLILLRQYMVKKEARSANWNRKQSTDDDTPMVMA